MAAEGPVERFWLLADGATIAFDSTISESHRSRLKVTKNPVETGVQVSDHAVKEPDELELEGAVSDHWLHKPQDEFSGGADPWSSDASRSATAWQTLCGIQKAAQPFSVQTGLKLYTNMVIEDLDADQDATTAFVLFARIRLVEVIQVSTETVVYPPRKAGKPARQAAKPVAGGEKASTEAKDAGVRRSIAVQQLPEHVKKAFSEKGFTGAIDALISGSTPSVPAVP